MVDIKQKNRKKKTERRDEDEVRDTGASLGPPLGSKGCKSHSSQVYTSAKPTGVHNRHSDSCLVSVGLEGLQKQRGDT